MKKLLCVLVLMMFSVNTAFAQTAEANLRNSVNKLHDQIVELVESDSDLAVEHFVLAVDDVLVKAEEAGITETDELISFVREDVIPKNAQGDFDAVVSKIIEKPTMKNIQQVMDDYKAAYPAKDEKVLGVLLGFVLLSALMIGFALMLGGTWTI
jgi:hypothetical protein